MVEERSQGRVLNNAALLVLLSQPGPENAGSLSLVIRKLVIYSAPWISLAPRRPSEKGRVKWEILSELFDFGDMC